MAGQRPANVPVHSCPNWPPTRHLRFTLYDTDGIHNRMPFVVSLSAVADDPPQLSLQLRGIGTRDHAASALPLAGEIVDDYGVDAAAFHVTIDEQKTVRPPFRHSPAGRSEFAVDEAFEVRDLELKPGQKILFGAEAQRCLSSGRRGSAAHGARASVSNSTSSLPRRLRTMLESRELNLRQRFETIIAEVTETRDSLATSRTNARRRRRSRLPTSRLDE